MVLRLKCNGAKVWYRSHGFQSSVVRRQTLGGKLGIGYKQLDVYQRSYQLAKEIHRLTQKFPGTEKYELGSQLRRSAVSIVLNIAEGYGRKESEKEFQHFLRNALGSCNEVRVLLDFCKDLNYLNETIYHDLEANYEIVSRQLYRLRESCIS